MYPTETVTLIPLQFVKNKFEFLASDQNYLNHVSFGGAKHTLISVERFLEFVAEYFTEEEWDEVYDSFDGHNRKTIFIDLEQ